MTLNTISSKQFVGFGSSDGVPELYVALDGGDVALVDGATGTFHSIFSDDDTAGVGQVNATDLVFGSNGDLYISDRQGDRVLRYDVSQGSNGIYEEFVPEGNSGLNLPQVRTVVHTIEAEISAPKTVSVQISVQLGSGVCHGRVCGMTQAGGRHWQLRRLLRAS